MTKRSGFSAVSSSIVAAAFAFSGCASFRPRSRATRATGGAVSVRPRPAGRSGCAMTSGTSKRASASASSERAANSGVPRKTRRKSAASAAAQARRGGGKVGVALLDRLELLLQALAAQDAQAVDEQHAVQVIDFVLHGAGEQSLAIELDALALLVQCFDIELGVALEAVVDAGDRQAA